ncbi:MAG: hypothetical protein KDA84_02830, partial [Planctomycetaceae bacterium]|nr:hypothetical protein [Planctomycetaceae bacterium]
IKRTPGRTEALDREPDQNTVVIDRNSTGSVVVEKQRVGELPANYEELAKKYRELQQRFDLLEVKLNQLNDKTNRSR